MAKALTLRLLVNKWPDMPGGEPADIGLQDAAGAVHAGQAGAEGAVRYTCDVQVIDKDGAWDWRGPMVHGTRGARFLYLSWKRRAPSPTPWIQRVKVPLAGLAEVEDAASPVWEADITGRRPHDRAVVVWRAVGR